MTFDPEKRLMLRRWVAKRIYLEWRRITIEKRGTITLDSAQTMKDAIYNIIVECDDSAWEDYMASRADYEALRRLEK